jgi:hypothetical protein
MQKWLRDTTLYSELSLVIRDETPSTIVYPLHSEIHYIMTAGLGIKERLLLAFHGSGA